ncbi:FAD dependent oxidoreductase [Pholiota conissans]|uniref:FAD dependent oxidoreductase n=1 Tax=Pholiota conissans TaxID=109636 RepID=A0A9P6D1J9_9AGAR|nr:FAD dependent oxidoreductase [Pholiota conissans]
MGGLFSSLRYAFQSIKSLVDGYETLSKRIALSPGVPQLNSSVPYWSIPLSPVAQHGKDKELPLYADVVVIGSGISGTSVAKALLDHVRGDPDSKYVEPLKVVMLEARDACSGATGRNGGHVVPNVYTEYFQLKKAYGAPMAREILRFRLSHISTLIDLAEEEGLLAESQARLVDDFDAFLHPEMFEQARKELDAYLKEVPKDLAEGFGVVEGREAIDKLQLCKSIHGCILKPGASIHPYRFITGLLDKLLTRYPNFELFTHTPCTNISSKNGIYTVSTPKGNINTPHVIHATNAWSSHLLPGMRKKIIPTRLHMSTQRPGYGLMPAPSNPQPNSQSNWASTRAFLFFSSMQEISSGKLKPEFAFDYLTQLLPASDDPTTTPLPTSGEFMFGGGAMLGGRSEGALLSNIGVVDDSAGDFEIEAYLSGALQQYFAEHWGQERSDPAEAPSGENVPWGKGRVKASWTGIIAISADMQPWVGRVPESVSGRKAPRSVLLPAPPHPRPPQRAPSCSTSTHSTIEVDPNPPLAAPGEWILAGYTGEGMVHAWLSGHALAKMILGVAGDEKGIPGLPSPFLITEKRVKAAKFEDLL